MSFRTFHQCWCFYKKKLLIQYPFDENIHAEDWDMNLRLTSLGYKVGFIDKSYSITVFYLPAFHIIGISWKMLIKKSLKNT